MTDCSCRRFLTWPQILCDLAYIAHCWRLGVRPSWHGLVVLLPPAPPGLAADAWAADVQMAASIAARR